MCLFMTPTSCLQWYRHGLYKIKSNTFAISGRWYVAVVQTNNATAVGGERTCHVKMARTAKQASLSLDWRSISWKKSSGASLLSRKVARQTTIC